MLTSCAASTTAHETGPSMPERVPDAPPRWVPPPHQHVKAIRSSSRVAEGAVIHQDHELEHPAPNPSGWPSPSPAPSAPASTAQRRVNTAQASHMTNISVDLIDHGQLIPVPFDAVTSP